ncbi:hypothetical protein V2J09_005663 [Rumex salicifolius]
MPLPNTALSRLLCQIVSYGDTRSSSAVKFLPHLRSIRSGDSTWSHRSSTAFISLRARRPHHITGVDQNPIPGVPICSDLCTRSTQDFFELSRSSLLASLTACRLPLPRALIAIIERLTGVVGLMFGNDDSTSNEDSYVERLLDRVNNGTKAEDRRAALTELQSVVAESHATQLAFGAMGFPVLISILKEERDDIEMVRGALETLLGALTPLNYAKAPKNDVQPATMNADLLSREVDSISLLLSLLAEDDFYIRYYTLQLLTALLNNSPSRLQEVILATPRGITRLMDMLLDREVIRNEALLLLTFLTREAEEIQKIVVFENAFEKIFSIIVEEGGSDGGVVVQDCLKLLKNILRNNVSNQTLLRETMGFDPVISLLKLRGSSYSFTQQKTINLLSAVETINLLTVGSSETHGNYFTNRAVLVQKGVMENLLMLGVESHWAPVAVRCAALRCIGDLISEHPPNKNVLANKVLGEEPDVEPAKTVILRIIMRTSSVQEFVAADYVLKNFCKKYPDGQNMLSSTSVPQQHSTKHDALEDDTNMSFESILLRGLTANENDGDLEICGRAASVFSHILEDNVSCKERALKIELEAPVHTLGGAEPLMHRLVKYLALASSFNAKDEKSKEKKYFYVQPIILKLLVTWLADCPKAVQCFLDSRPHLTYFMELVTNQSTTVCTRGLAAILLGECVLYNESTESSKDAFSIADAISQKIGFTSYFLKFDEMLKSSIFSSTKQSEQSKPMTRSPSASMAEIQDGDDDGVIAQSNQDHPILESLFDDGFHALLKKLEADIRERVVLVYSRPKSSVAIIPAELEQNSGENDQNYINRLKSFVQKQCYEIQDLLSRNASLAEDLTKSGRTSEPRLSSGPDRVQVETLRRELQEASQRVEMLKTEKAKMESEAVMYKNLAGKVESDLKSLSDAYNSLEQVNYHLEIEVKQLRGGKGGSSYLDVESIKAEAREEAQKESEAELNDLLVCLGQEQSKVDRLCTRLEELGEDVDTLLEGIGDETGLPEEDDDDEE